MKSDDLRLAVLRGQTLKIRKLCISPFLIKVYNLVDKKGSATAHSIYRELNHTLANASRSLGCLYDAGYLDRERIPTLNHYTAVGGLRYTYTIKKYNPMDTL